MTRVERFRAIIAVFGSSMIVSLLGSAKAAQPLEKFDRNNFNHSTVIDNEWYPIKPGTQCVMNGYALYEEGDEEPHSDVFTVTDLVKEIAGVRTVVCWDKDYVDGELEEA